MIDLTKPFEVIYPPIKEKFKAFFEEAAGINAYPFSVFRTLQEQRAEWDKGRKFPGDIVTDARPGFSYHNYGLAFDMAWGGSGKWTWDVPFEKWKELSAIAKKYDIECGIDWPDPYIKDCGHYQISFNISVQRLYAEYAKTWHLEDVWAWLSTNIHA
jgi:peptidoglycan L-alanyl-D-glutamate endopeptidase CwlK